MTTRKILLNSDYEFIQKSIPMLGYFGVAGHISFYLILRFLFGYWESWQLRLCFGLGFGAFIFYPRERPLSTALKAYFEFAVALGVPGFFTFMFLKNGINVYWYASLVFAGLVHGMVSKPVIYVWAYPLATGLAAMGFLGLNPEMGPLVTESLKAQLIAYFLGAIATAMKTGMEMSHEKIMRTTLALSKAENELLRAEETKRAYLELKKREELIRIFIRPSLVEEIRNGKDPSQFQPTLRDLAIMFCDIRDFTSLTEILSPQQKQAYLNEYFTLMTGPILENDGEVDKIMGDCVMGIFPDGEKAIRAAIGMRNNLNELNRNLQGTGNRPIRNGIGIAKGEVMQGNFGSHQKMDRTVIGDAVNIASRLESKTKMYNLDIVVTEDVVGDFHSGAAHSRWIDVVKVKGSNRKLKLYEVYGHESKAIREYKDGTRTQLEDALSRYFTKDFRLARKLFAALRDEAPLRSGGIFTSDRLLDYYLDHCDTWIGDMGGAEDRIVNWDGVHVFTEK